MLRHLALLHQVEYNCALTRVPITKIGPKLNFFFFFVKYFISTCGKGHSQMAALISKPPDNCFIIIFLKKILRNCFITKITQSSQQTKQQMRLLIKIVNFSRENQKEKKKSNNKKPRSTNFTQKETKLELIHKSHGKEHDWIGATLSGEGKHERHAFTCIILQVCIISGLEWMRKVLRLKGFYF